MSDTSGGDRAAHEPLQRFGDYQLVRKIAQGGMAEIFLGRRVGIAGFEKKLVIKRMIDRLASSPEFVTMFLDEARIAARLDHPNIAQITDFGVIDSWYYIAMEYVPGEDLRNILRVCADGGTLLPIPVALKIALGVSDALE